MSGADAGGSHAGAHAGQAAHSGQSGHVHHSGQIGDFSNANILGADIANISWSTLFQGLKVSSGIRFFIVFAAFTGWLYVIYWIRHHEPFSNQVLGIAAPQSSTAAADRSLIDGIRKVFPFQTSATYNNLLYAPSPSPPAPVVPPPAISSRDLPAGAVNASESSYFGQGIDGRALFTEGIQVPRPAITYVAPGQAISAPMVNCWDQDFDSRFGSPNQPLLKLLKNQ